MWPWTCAGDRPPSGTGPAPASRGENKRQLYIAEGFAHGFYVVSEQALFAYKCTDVYDAACERAVLWSDPAIGIQWPNDSPTLSEKDGAAPLLGALAPDDLPPYAG
jgi:dTDP-4-dehydrorhamnose 3,5-epimerase